MAKATYVLVDNSKDWQPYYPSDHVISVKNYIENSVKTASRLQLINLSKQSDYLSLGYYASLLAEARGHRVIPSVETISYLVRKDLGELLSLSLSKCEKRFFNELDNVSQTFQFQIYFGKTQIRSLRKLAHAIFEHLVAPILIVKFVKEQSYWRLDEISLGNLEDISEESEQYFAQSLEEYSRRIWRLRKHDKHYRYDLAILYNPEEKTPPSDIRALNKFVKIGAQLGINVDLITLEQGTSLLEYDALFIRETTKVNHHTYRLAQLAKHEGLVVIDSPEAILKCTNKIFLAELLAKRKIPIPKTEIISDITEDTIVSLEYSLGYPMVIKIPDGSFSIGVEKVNNQNELKLCAQKLFQDSALLLLQQYLPTDFDWRVGVLNGRAIYCCKYYMARNHWQIYKKKSNGSLIGGGAETLSIAQAPKTVISTAIKAAKAIGDGLFGVDLKSIDDQGVYVIEINDNPSIDSGLEDAFLGDELYRAILNEFISQIEKQGN
ncbi:RimK family protein [Thiotrichales bacterium 19S3-7]|nr:RimK family protein [Thiotrichales bacterium 19S3-7]MCF6801306.1 RimK family protein [Thiotrichales bacterium 19S3-11]